MREQVKKIKKKIMIFCSLLVLFLPIFVQPILVYSETLATTTASEITDTMVQNDRDSMSSANVRLTDSIEGGEMPSEEKVVEEITVSENVIPSEEKSVSASDSIQEVETKSQRDALLGGQDKTELINDLKVNFAVRHGSEWKSIIENNVSVTNPPMIYIGNEIRFSFEWNILEEAMTQLSLGDYFSIKLPQTYITFEDTGEIPFKDQDGRQIGVYQIVNGTIRVELNEEGLTCSKISEAYVSATGLIVSSGTEEDWEVTEGVTIPPITIDPGTDQEDKENGHMTPIVKYGAQMQNKNELAWTMYINQDNEAKRFRGETLNPYYNAYLIDELSEGQEFSSVRIQTVLMATLDNGHMSDRALFWYTLDTIPDQVLQTNEATLEEFKATLKGNGLLSYGVFNNETVAIYLGDIPNTDTQLPNAITTNDYAFLKNLLQEQMDKGKINQNRYDSTLQYYRDNPEIVSFGITMYTKLDGENKEVKNTAHLVAETREESSNESTVNYQNIEGGATSVKAKALKIKKKDDSNNKLKDIVFSLEKKDDSGDYQPYQPLSGEAQRSTDSNGEVVFENLKAGDYRVVEETRLPNYGEPIFSNKGEFTIKDSDVIGVTVDVVNPALTEVEVVKRWEDNNNQDGKRPSSVQVQLYANDEKSGSEVNLEAGNAWTYIWSALPKNFEGKEILYTVKEVNKTSGYEPTYETELNGRIAITNTYIPETTEVSGTKTWDDANNQDGHRPTNITINLLANGRVIESREVTEATGWAYRFTDLPKFENGQEISYTITEDSVAGYTTAVQNNSITNTYTPGRTSATVTKAWNDHNNQDGKRPRSIQVQLYADDKKSGPEVTLNEGNNWTNTWSDLAEKQAGQTIEYTVKEVNTPEGYTSVVTDTNQGNMVITNTYIPEKTEMSGTKTWDDANNQDGHRPANITINLLANGRVIDSREVTEASGWAYHFTDLPKFENGQEIIYTITEDSVPGYTTVVQNNSITNTYTPGRTSATVTKAWNDHNNQDGKRPSSIQVQLYADDKKSGPEVTLNEGNNWTTTWSDLVEKQTGKMIEYTVKEVNTPEGYTSVVTDTNQGNMVITNTYIPETTEASGTKTWDDANNQDGQRPASIIINLLANGQTIDSREVTEESGWAYRFTDLPKFENGQEIIYTITEDSVAGYTTAIQDHNIANTYTPGRTSATVTKAWNDHNNQDGKRPSSIHVQLYADDKKSGPEVTLNEGNNWTNTWSDLAEKQAGQTIEYTVKEVNPPEGYTSLVTDTNQGNMVITNTYIPEKTEMSGTKTWDDAKNQDGQRPASIIINLLANGQTIDSQEVTEGTGWAYRFTDLPKFENGQEISYTITEDSVAGYTTAIHDHNITNTYTPGRTSATVTKAWNDHNNQDGKRPSSIQVQLYADGKKSGPEVTLDGAKKWTYTWRDLMEKAEGETIVYTVKEVEVAKGYEASYEQGNRGNFIITNSHTPTLKDKPKDKNKPETPSKKLLPKTGEKVRLSIIMLGLLVVVSTVYIRYSSRKIGEEKGERK